jgi:type I restriction enzyme, R subunit
VIDERVQTIAKELTKYLKATDRMAKTIVFCENTEHAAMMRMALQNENKDIEQLNYVVRITGNEFKSDLDANLYDFIDQNKSFPVIATTSKLLSTGVDTKTVKVIVLDSNIRSLSDFKQIIGRGTRVKEDYGKTYFTILDFRQITNLFADPDFDGAPIQTFEVKEGDEITAENLELPDNLQSEEIQAGKGISWEETWQEKLGKRVKYYVNGVIVNVLGKRTQILDEHGKLVNIELEAKQKLKDRYTNLNEFINDWNQGDKRDAIIDELRQKGIYLAEIAYEYEKKYQKSYDFFDLIVHIAFDRPALSRKDRMENVKKRDIFGKYSKDAQKVLFGLLDKYGDKGVQEIKDMTTLSLAPISEVGSPLEIMEIFGGVDGYKKAVKELEMEIYREV